MENEFTGAYGPIGNEEFHKRLEGLISLMDSDEIAEIPSIYDILAEHLREQVNDDYETDNLKYLDYDTVLEMFLDGKTVSEMIIDYKYDLIMLREDFNNYTDGLCKDDQISEYACNNWDNPF